MYDEERNNRGPDRRRNWNDESEDRPERSSPKHEKKQDTRVDESWDNEVESRWKENEPQNKADVLPESDIVESKTEDKVNNENADQNVSRVTTEEIFETHEPSEAVESASKQYQEESKGIEEQMPENTNTSEDTSINQKENIETQEGGTTPLFDE